MTHPYKNSKGNFLFIGVPGETYDHTYDKHRNIISADIVGSTNVGDWFSPKLPPGNWQIICTFPGASEAEAALVVDNRLSFSGYKNYKFLMTDETSFPYKTTTESLASLMESENLYTVNPLGEKPKVGDYSLIVEQAKIYYDDLEQWQQAQERKFAKWVILKKEV